MMSAASSGLLRRVPDRPLLDLGNSRGHADDDPWTIEAPRAPTPSRDPPSGLDEVLQHPLGDVEIGDDAVLQRAERLDVLGRAAEHRLGLVPDPDDLVVGLADRDDRRLVEDDAAIADEHEGVGGSEVDRQVRREQPE